MAKAAKSFGVAHIDEKRPGCLEEAIKVIPTLPVVITIKNPATVAI
jgi:hypothetical protein